ncbi:MAG: rhomboid family intramembrane serine protease, partial [Planctomycetota bacterium]|nr:rhomboid family intramembrane serine protease [Planctomycetota bacterium]
VPNSHFLGMSGVIYGLFGYAWTRGKYDPSSGLRLNPQVVFILVLWLVICLFGFMPIANVAHVTGLLSGMAVGGWPLIVGRRF